MHGSDLKVQPPLPDPTRANEPTIVVDSIRGAVNIPP